MRRLRAHSEPCLVTGDYAHAAPRSSTRLLRGSPHCEQRFRQLFPERPSLASSRPPERPGRLREASSGPQRLARLPRNGATETSAPGAAQVGCGGGTRAGPDARAPLAAPSPLPGAAGGGGGAGSPPHRICFLGWLSLRRGPSGACAPAAAQVAAEEGRGLAPYPFGTPAVARRTRPRSRPGALRRAGSRLPGRRPDLAFSPGLGLRKDHGRRAAHRRAAGSPAPPGLRRLPVLDALRERPRLPLQARPGAPRAPEEARVRCHQEPASQQGNGPGGRAGKPRRRSGGGRGGALRPRAWEAASQAPFQPVFLFVSQRLGVTRFGFLPPPLFCVEKGDQ